jgi:hypothetical protein
MSVPMKDALDALLPKQQAEIDRRLKEQINEAEFLKRRTLFQWLARRQPRNTGDDRGDRG